MIYEFDPADIMYSYMYPAMVRTFRTAGFQWITQFAYDPMDIAYANTEYQTHFLNLAYTPHKAISMKIASEAAQSLKRGASYEVIHKIRCSVKDFQVSYTEDLSELNNGNKFYYSNTHPYATQRCLTTGIHRRVWKFSCCALRRYRRLFHRPSGRRVWRLEVMPDAIIVNDPFAKPSLEKEVVTIAYGAWDMASLQLPEPGKCIHPFRHSIAGQSNTCFLRPQREQQKEEVKDGVIHSLRPGVYLLQRKHCAPKQNLDSRFAMGNTIRLGEYAAPHHGQRVTELWHTPATTVEANKPLKITVVR